MTDPQPFVSQTSTASPEILDARSQTPLLGDDVAGSTYQGRIVVEIWQVPASSAGDGLHIAVFGSFGRGSRIPVQMLRDLAGRLDRRANLLGR